MTDLKVTEDAVDAAGLDLARYVRPGALVAWGQGCAEPLTLTGRPACSPAHRPMQGVSPLT